MIARRLESLADLIGEKIRESMDSRMRMLVLGIIIGIIAALTVLALR